MPTLPDASTPAAAAPLRGPGQALAAGTDLGRFKVIRLAGVGGMGEVYKAWDTLLERHVALKSVLSEDLENDAPLARFRWEARALAQLSHPHVCQVYDLVTLGAVTYIAMEWLDGETLEVVAARLCQSEKLRVLRAVADGLAYAHSKALVHRDLKPANIMVLADGGVKILDFGLARLGLGLSEVPVAAQDALAGLSGGSVVTLVKGGDLATACVQSGSALPERDEALTRQGMFMGSPRYASPEQIRGELAGTPSDVWSLGMLAWELLLSENPFPGDGVARLRAVLDGRRAPARGRGLNRRLCKLLEGLLAMDAQARPRAETVSATLARELQPRRSRWWLAAQAASLLLVGTGMYFLFGRGVAADLTRRTPARLAIYPATDRTGLPKAAVLVRHLLPDLLGAGLRNAERLQVVDAEELGRAAQGLHLDLAQGCNEAVMTKVAAAVGAKLYLAPVLELDSQRQAVLVVELRDGGGRLRYRTQAVAVADAATLPVACIQLAERVTRDLAKAVDPLSSQRPPALPALDQAALDRYATATGLIEQGDYPGAEPHFREVAYQYPAFAPGVKGYARCLAKTGSQPADPVFMWARMAAKEQGYFAEEAHILQYQVAYHWRQGNRDRAMGLCREGLALTQSPALTFFRATFLSQLGGLQQSQNRLAEAEASFTSALACMVAAQNPQGIARISNNLAVLEKSQGRLEQAQARYRQVLSTLSAYGDHWGEAVALNNLGELHLTLGKLDQAEGFLTRALKLRTALADDAGLTYVLVNLAGLAQARGELEQGVSYNLRALELARRTQVRPMEGLCLYNLGELQRAAGRYPEAIQSYRAAAALHRVLADRDMQSHALAGEAECLARQAPARLEGARRLLKQALALSAGENPYLLRTQAWVARISGEEARARELFQKSLDQARSGAPEMMRELNSALL